MGQFVIRKVSTGVKFDLKAANGETVATSEVYRTEAACRKGVESVRKCAAVAGLEDQTQEEWKPAGNPKFQLYRDRSGGFRFRLTARNGKVIAVSEGYTTCAAALSGIDSVRKNALDE